MADPFSIMVSNLQQLGFYGFLLPWIFTFAVFFGMLVKTQVLGEDKRIAGVVSLVAAFFITAYAVVPLGEIFSSVFGMASIVLAGILVIVLFAGMLGYKLEAFTENKVLLASVIIIGIVIFAIAGALAMFEVEIGEMTIAAIILVVLLAAAVWFIGKAE